MKSIIKIFKRYIPKLKAKGALPLLDKMNWNFDPEFDYGFGPVESKSQKVAVSKDAEKVCKDSESGECSA